METIDGAYPTAHLLGIADEVRTGSLRAAPFGDGWLGFAAAHNDEVVALRSDDGLSWELAGGELVGLPDDLIWVDSLWALGDDLVLTGIVEIADDFREQRRIIARSSDGVRWHAFRDFPATATEQGFGIPQSGVSADGSVLGFLAASSGNGGQLLGPLDGSAELLLLRADAPVDAVPERVEPPSGFRFLVVHSGADHLAVDLVVQGVALYQSVLVGRDGELRPLGDVGLRGHGLAQVIGDVIFGGAGRVSLNEGETWQALTTPIGEPVPHGALDREGRVSREGYVSRDGLHWEPIPMAQLEYRVLASTERGVLLLWIGADNLVSFIPWPETTFSDLDPEQQAAFRVERNQVRIDYLVSDLIGALFRDDRLALRSAQDCMRAEAVDDSVTAVLAASAACDVDVLEGTQSAMIAALERFPTSPERDRCLIDQATKLSAEELIEIVGAEYDFQTGLIALNREMSRRC